MLPYFVRPFQLSICKNFAFLLYKFQFAIVPEYQTKVLLCNQFACLRKFLPVQFS